LSAGDKENEESKLASFAATFCVVPTLSPEGPTQKRAAKETGIKLG